MRGISGVAHHPLGTEVDRDALVEPARDSIRGSGDAGSESSSHASDGSRAG
jgi:hypothetical protein